MSACNWLACASVSQSASANQQKMASMEGDLSSTKHELLKIREMLEMAEKVTSHRP